MSTRIQVVVDEEERERFREHAARREMSLSAWLREAARRQLAEEESQGRIDSRAALEEFFAACDARERGREPDWEQHEAVIERSMRSGATET